MVFINIIQDKSMKTQEEIEKLANDWLTKTPIKEWGGAENGFIKGYTQCQEDMADKKYTDEDIINAIQYGIDIEAGNIKFDYKKYPDSFTQYIQSINKQD